MADVLAETAQQPSPLPYGMSELTDAECRELLHRQRLCVVSVVDGDRPYAVPVFYGFDGHTIYLGVMEGRKTRALDVNARVCIVVTEVGPDDSWRSVVLEGAARELTNPEERANAVQVLIAHNRRADGRSMSGEGSIDAPRPRHGGGRVVRIDEGRISGRTKRRV